MNKGRIKMFISSLIVISLGVVLVLATIKTVRMNKWEYRHISKGEVPEKMVGINIKDPQDVDRLEVMPDIVSWFEDWYSDSGAGKLELCSRNNSAIPLITWQPNNVSFEDIINGKHDAYIQKFFKRIAKQCPDLTVLIRFAHEMEDDPSYNGWVWYQWQGKDEYLYKRAWRHLVNMSHKICPQVKWIWSPNRFTKYSRAYYPGDEYVDYVGITVNIKKEVFLKDFGDRFQEIGGEGLREYNKPIIISELGIHSEQEDREDSIRFIKGVFKFFKQDPDMVAVVFFNTDKNSVNRRYNFTDSDVCVKVFCDEITKLRKEQNKKHRRQELK